MIDRLVQLEEERWNALGYDTVVTPVSMEINTAEKIMQLGNETVILTGIRMSSYDVVADTETKLILVSPTESFVGTQRELSQLGTSIFKLFKDSLIIKVRTQRDTIPTFRLDFIKVTPYIRKQS